MKNVFLFPGQGAQKKGMFFDICKNFPEAQKTLKFAEEISEENISKILWETEDEEIARSDKSQLAITTTSLILVNLLKSKNITADICAGFSLGEFSALFTSGVLTFEDTIRLVTARGKIMQKVCEKIEKETDGNKPGMAAVIGILPDKILSLINPLEQKGIAFAANLNSPKQTVIAGTSQGLEQAEKIFINEGCRRFIRLKVAGPFHSPLMKDAADEFEEIIKYIQFSNPQISLLSNVTGKEIKSGEEIKKRIIEHFTNPVRWFEEETAISKIIKTDEENCSENWEIFEVGVGNVLSGLWKDSGYAQNIQCKSINTVETLNI